ncbi:MAG TPA: hypothetical protein ENK18_02250 [Deltaproteobacteria bacterium]|nr:hypothetical protein [Deltaproteobacteria bacterium]
MADTQPVAGPRRVHQRIAYALALFLPCLILLLCAVVTGDQASEDDRRQENNAGRIINGRVVQGGVREHIEDLLVQHQPRVLILGNSLANTDVLPQILARRLHLNKHAVQKLTVPNSIGAHWYAILANRVYANGHTPELVVLHSDLQSLLAVTPRSEASYLNLAVHLGEEEPVFDRLLGHRLWFLDRIRESRSLVRNQVLVGARNLSVDLLYHHSLTATPPRATERALSRVFDEGHIDMRLHGDVIPTFAQGQQELIAFDPESLPRPAASFVPEIAALVREHGGVAVFVRPPMSPRMPSGVGDLVAEGVEEEVAGIAAEFGGRYLDLRGLDMDPWHFHNLDHMQPQGARRFTEILADTLIEIGAFWLPEASRSLDLLAPTRIVDDRLINIRPRLSFRRAPPPIRSKQPPRPGRKALAVFETPHLGQLSDAATVEATRTASRCSPVRVLEDGSPLPHPNVSCDAVRRAGHGRLCHTADRVHFSASDDTHPSHNGRDYALALDPDRWCDGAVWLYPGDLMRISLQPGDLSALIGGIGGLTLSARSASPQRGQAQTLKIQIRRHQAVWVSERRPLRGSGEATWRIPIRPPIDTSTEHVSVDVINKSGGFVLLTGARLQAYTGG